MFVSIESGGVGYVENGKIVTMFDSETSIKDLYTHTAKQIQSDEIGTQVDSDRLVQITRSSESYTVTVHLGRSISQVKPQTKLSELNLQRWI
jgi:hypothetical protein